MIFFIKILITKYKNKNRNKNKCSFKEIRKELFNKFGKEKLYSDGLIIKTALDSEIQKNANLSLIEGLIEYEKKQGWHGLIENTNFDNFFKKTFSIKSCVT